MLLEGGTVGMVDKRPIVIVGGGGHARVLAKLIRACEIEIHGVVDPDEASVKLRLPLEQFLSDRDDFILQLDPKKVRLAIGVGSLPLSPARKAIFERFSVEGFYFPPLVHPWAHVAPDVALAPGVQVMAGAVIQSGTELGECSIANTRASIDHECKVGEFAHIAPGAVLCGCVSIGAHSFIGPGCIVTHNLTVGERSIVGAGSVVLENLPESVRTWGAPARYKKA
jgi:sugar O-acyltransferase (sialic acid O-acetyltransferase NeuD family)